MVRSWGGIRVLLSPFLCRAFPISTFVCKSRLCKVRSCLKSRKIMPWNLKICGKVLGLISRPFWSEGLFWRIAFKDNGTLWSWAVGRLVFYWIFCGEFGYPKDGMSGRKCLRAISHIIRWKTVICGLLSIPFKIGYTNFPYLWLDQTHRLSI